ncbi:MAG: hypothetical protein KAH84_02425 [Thiomargarita sp.]|nr:hypothetical protein [Thiomargarita sp.]
MNTASLSLEQTPPFSVPFRFFFTAPLFGILASLLLLYDGPAILSHHSYPSMYPNTIALTHLLTLGFITMTMFGAILQLLPVLAGSLIPFPVLTSTILHILLTLGTLSLVGYFISHQIPILAVGITLLSLAFLFFIGIMAYCLIRVKGQSPTIHAMYFALAALVITVILGITASLFFMGIRFLPFYNFYNLVGLHFTWGLVGWVSLLIIGVAYQVIPMFHITPQYPPFATRYFVPTLFIALLIWTLLVYIYQPLLLLISAMFIVIGLSFFAILTLYLHRKRLRKLPDITLKFWQMGLIVLLISVPIWLVSSVETWLIIDLANFAYKPTYSISSGLFFIMGFILPIIQGMLYKIVPFLVWLHLQNQQLSQANIKIPNMKQVIPDKLAKKQFWLYVAAFILLIISLWLPQFIYLASLGFLGSFCFLTFNLFKALQVYKITSQKLRESCTK